MSDAYRVSVSARIPAPSGRIYGIIADYRNGHPHILPPAFSNLEVEQGGVGAGTIIRFNVRALGRTQLFRSVVTEPEPGRVLVETNVEIASMFANQFFPAVTQTLAGLAVNVENGRFIVKQKEGVSRLIHEGAEARLARAHLGH